MDFKIQNLNFIPNVDAPKTSKKPNLAPMPNDSVEISFGRRKLFSKKKKIEEPKKVEKTIGKKTKATMQGIIDIQKSIKDVDIDNAKLSLNEDGYVKVEGYPEFESDLNKTLILFDAFKNTIGKAQNGNHDYTLDKHLLKVVQNVVLNPDFDNLSNKDKNILTIAALMHDVSKKEGEKDPYHAINSAYTTSIALKRLDIDDKDKKTIFNVIKLHHWLEKANDPDNNNMVNGLFYSYLEKNGEKLPYEKKLEVARMYTAY